MRSELTYERLVSLLRYEPLTGVFIRRVDVMTGQYGKQCVARAGDIAGWTTEYGYVRVTLGGQCYLAHRLAWFYMTGAWPAGQVDHLNGARTDNRWTNLREATAAVNSQNQRVAYPRNKSGFLGVRAFRAGWTAQITVARKQVYLGNFSTPEAAHEAYVKAKRELHAGCTL